MNSNKPPHSRYAISWLYNETYTNSTITYSNYKPLDVRDIYAFLGGSGLWAVVIEVSPGTVVQYRKRCLATLVITGAIYLYVCMPAVVIITNATKVIKTCKIVYTTIGFTMELVQDSSHVTFLPLDLLLVGKPIRANKPNHFSFWSKITHRIDNLPGIGDS